MAWNSPLHAHVGRKTPAKGVRLNLSGPNILWVTICSKDRETWMAQRAVVEILNDVWLNHATAWLVGDYLVMPDHAHFFCGPKDFQFTVERWLAYFKECFSKRNSQTEWRWQRGGFHHRVRSQEEFAKKWTYMMENPVRKGLVVRMEDWPWKGRVHDVRWH